ncbi:hypothetical protein ACP70R_003315 [Stipagrostis hirtigluma subsp. patula]
MANLVAMNIKRKDAEVASHGFCILLDPKRIKLQDATIMEMMEEEEPQADADASPANVQPTMSMPMPSPVMPIQGPEVLQDRTASGTQCSEPPFSAGQAAPMDIEADFQQYQAPVQPQQGQQAPFFSGWFLLKNGTRPNSLAGNCGSHATYAALQPSPSSYISTSSEFDGVAT